MTQRDIFKGVETTTWMDHDGALVGLYRGTAVAKRLENTITLKTGGWKTRTTKHRMNQFANNFVNCRYSVYQKDHQWFVVTKTETIPFDGDSLTFEV
jgi:hypothetical protein